MHQTLGESIEDFMRISGAKMCASQKPQAAQWCEAFKKIQAGEKSVVTDSQGSTSVSLVFAEKRLVQVLVQGKAAWGKSITEFTQKYGAPDVQTANAAEWAFGDGGGISVNGQPGNLFTATFFSKDAKSTECRSQEIRPTAIRGHVIGESAADFFSKAGLPALLSSCQEKKQKPNKKTCEAVLAALSGKRVATTDPRWQSTDGAILSGGKLVLVYMSFVQPMTEVLPDLENKYGKASRFNVGKAQNGYGANWEVGSAFWDMPDGTIISAIETVSLGEFAGYFRVVEVELRSKEEASKARENESSHHVKLD